MIHFSKVTLGLYYYKNQVCGISRADGPAVETVYGYKEWRLNGLLHREDGPAIEYANNRKRYFLLGKEVTLAEITLGKT